MTVAGLPAQLEEDGVDIVAGHVGRWRVGFKVDRIFRKGGKERFQAFLGQEGTIELDYAHVDVQTRVETQTAET